MLFLTLAFPIYWDIDISKVYLKPSLSIRWYNPEINDDSSNIQISDSWPRQQKQACNPDIQKIQNTIGFPCANCKPVCSHTEQLGVQFTQQYIERLVLIEKKNHAGIIAQTSI